MSVWAAPLHSRDTIELKDIEAEMHDSVKNPTIRQKSPLELTCDGVVALLHHER